MEAVKDFFEEGNVASNEYGVSSQRKPNRPTKVILATLHIFLRLNRNHVYDLNFILTGN